ncbi:hypothetical protein HBB16_06645 [Pseudonocardia sp. MCCB 268]|nr:hypothetical protein [Pseudonocardia cytotoxica]
MPFRSPTRRGTFRSPRPVCSAASRRSGCLVGAIGAAGLLTDRLGRRRLVLLSTAVFSLAMLLAPPLGARVRDGRLLVGSQSQVCCPRSPRLSTSNLRRGRRSSTLRSPRRCRRSGVRWPRSCRAPTDRSSASAWSTCGGAAALVVPPGALRFLPESLIHLRSRGRPTTRCAGRTGLVSTGTSRRDLADDVTAWTRWGCLRLLFSARYRATTIPFGLATFLSLLVLFALHLVAAAHAVGRLRAGFRTDLPGGPEHGTAVGPPGRRAIADRIGSRRRDRGACSYCRRRDRCVSQPCRPGCCTPSCSPVSATVGNL